MKKLFLMILCLIITFAFFGCNSNKEQKIQKGKYYIVGDYEDTSTPYIQIDLSDNTFEISKGDSYNFAVHGDFKINDNTIVAMTENGKYIFEIKSKSELLLIDILGDNGISFPDNSKFLYN